MTTRVRTPPAPSTTRADSKPTWGGVALAGLHLAVLWSFAFAQPLLDLLGDAPEFFVARENTRGDIILLALTVTLVPPLALTAVEAGLWAVAPRLRRALHLLLVALLVAAFVLQLLGDGPGGSASVLIPIAVAVGAGAALFYERSRAVPMLLTVLSPLPLVFLVVFLGLSPVSKLVLPGAEVETSDAAIPRDAPVVMIVFDELSGLALMGPDGQINESRYPNFARLADDATWYRNATTVADFTGRALPALLSGKVPDSGAAPIASDYPRSLFTLLGGKYSFDVQEPVSDVCPERLCPGETAGRVDAGTRLRELASDLSVVSLHLLLPDDLARDLPAVDRSFGDFRELAGAQGVTGADRSSAASGRGFAALVALGQRDSEFHEFSRGLGHAPERAHLSFLHVELPHNPYHFLPSGQRYPDALGDPPGLGAGWTRNRWLAGQGFQRYLLQVGYADRLLGEAVERLRSSGRYDRSLIVVMADHGASFVPGESYRAATEGNLPQVASIPLLIKAPGQERPRVDDANVRSIDVLPTIAARLGVRLRWDLAGRPASRRRPLGEVFVQPQNGADDVTMPFPEFVRRRDARVKGMLADFGTAPAGLYGAGPDGDLAGRPVSALAPATTAEGRFELDAGGLLASVDPRGSVVPSFITGRLTAVEPRARLAIAVNGRVAATTVSFADDGIRRFAAIVSPSAFVRGRNTVEVIAVTGTGAGRRLERLRGSALGYRLVRDGGRETIVDSSGRRFPIAASAVQGFIDDQTIVGADLSIRGWAGTTDPPRAADRVVVFVGGGFTAAGRPAVVRDDLRRKYGRGLARAGFELRGGVLDLGSGVKRPPVRAFALAGGRASQLSGPSAP